MRVDLSLQILHPLIIFSVNISIPFQVYSRDMPNSIGRLADDDVDPCRMAPHLQVAGKQSGRNPMDLPWPSAAGDDLRFDGVEAKALHLSGDWVVRDVLYRFIATTDQSRDEDEQRADAAEKWHLIPPETRDARIAHSTELKLANSYIPPQVVDAAAASIYVLDITRPEAARLIFGEREAGLHRAQPTGRRPGLWQFRAVARSLAQIVIDGHFADAGIVLCHDASGRPRLRAADGSEPAFISISHSRGRVAVAVAYRPVGIDIEYADPVRLTRGGPAMLRSVGEATDGIVAVTDANFYAVWTAYEAAIKVGASLKALVEDGSASVRTLYLENDYVLTVALA